MGYQKMEEEINNLEFETELPLDKLVKVIEETEDLSDSSNQKLTKIGLVGFGVVNQAIYKNIKNTLKDYVEIYSLENQYINNFAKTLDTDLNIITINTDYFPDKINKKDIVSGKNNFKKFGSKKSVKGLVELLKAYHDFDYKGILVIKSTVLPKLLEKRLFKKYKLKLDNFNLIFWPEFLNARTAEKDFITEIPLFGGDPILIEKAVQILNKFLIQGIHYYSTGTFTEVMEYKYFRNMLLMNHFAFLNTVPDLFETDIRRFNQYQKEHAYSFNEISIAQDGKLGVGGACLPKDLDNFIQAQYNLKGKKYLPKLDSELDSLNHLKNISNYNKTKRI